MEKFIREMRQLARHSDEENPDQYRLFKAGHTVTARAFVRELKKAKLTTREMKAARRFLQIVGYNKQGKARQDPGEVFDHALTMHREGTKSVLNLLETIAKNLQRVNIKNKINSSAARNPCINIACEAINARTFLKKTDLRELHEDINASKISLRAKARLRKYLEEK